MSQYFQQSIWFLWFHSYSQKEKSTTFILYYIQVQNEKQILEEKKHPTLTWFEESYKMAHSSFQMNQTEVLRKISDYQILNLEIESRAEYLRFHDNIIDILKWALLPVCNSQ